VWKSIVSMVTNLGVPLARGRLTSEQESVEDNWSEFSQWDIGNANSVISLSSLCLQKRYFIGMIVFSELK